MATTSKHRTLAPALPVRAVGYVRISQDREVQSSTRTQAESIRAYCASQGWECVDIIEERGRSAYGKGRNNRPGLKEVRRMIEAGAANAVVVLKISRAFRNTRDLLEHTEWLRDRDAFLACTLEPIDSREGGMGKVLMTILGAIAEMESTNKGDFIREWNDDRKLNGLTPNGPRPYGYRREHNRLLVNEDEAAIIRDAAEAVLDGETLRAIIAGLKTAGVTTKTGRPWTHRSLIDVLTRPTIAALREVGPGEYLASDAWTAILDRDQWTAVRDILLDPARRTTTGPTRRWFLAGFARCGRCNDGTVMKSAGHQAGPRYQCPQCKMSIDAVKTDEVVGDAILAPMNASTWRRLRSRGGHVDTSALQARVLELAQRNADGEMDDDEYEIQRAGLKRRIAEAAQAPVTLPDVPNIRAGWPTLDAGARRLVLEATIERVVILPPVKSINRFDEDRIQVTPVE